MKIGIGNREKGQVAKATAECPLLALLGRVVMSELGPKVDEKRTSPRCEIRLNEPAIPIQRADDIGSRWSPVGSFFFVDAIKGCASFDRSNV